MGISELLWACRRRWRLIVATLALALAVGWLTTPAQATSNKPPKKKVSYHATEILLPNGGVSLDRLALARHRRRGTEPRSSGLQGQGAGQQRRANQRQRDAHGQHRPHGRRGVDRPRRKGAALHRDRYGSETSGRSRRDIRRVVDRRRPTPTRQAQFNTAVQDAGRLSRPTRDRGEDAQQPARPRGRGRGAQRRNPHGSAQRGHPTVVGHPGTHPGPRQREADDCTAPGVAKAHGRSRGREQRTRPLRPAQRPRSPPLGDHRRSAARARSRSAVEPSRAKPCTASRRSRPRRCFRSSPRSRSSTSSASAATTS